MDLTPGQQQKIQRLIEDELREALRAALERSDAATVGELVADRRRALEQLIRGSAQDPQDPLDQEGEGGGIVEQR